MLCGSQDVSPVQRGHPRVNTLALRSERHHISPRLLRHRDDDNGRGGGGDGVVATSRVAL